MSSIGLSYCSISARIEAGANTAGITAQSSDRTAGFLQALTCESVGPLDAIADGVWILALGKQHVGRLQLDHEAGECVREHVVDVTGDPRRLFESGGSQLLLVRALRLGQQQLGLLKANPGLTDIRSAESHGREAKRIGEHAERFVVVDDRTNADRRRPERRHDQTLQQTAPGGCRHRRDEGERAGSAVLRGHLDDAPADRDHVQVRGHSRLTA